jgi:pantetheine-phosphate adenylyltransferase
MQACVYPGSFDPVTNGHLDIIKRASSLFDRVIVSVLINNNKKPLFPVEKRMEFIKKACRDIPGVEVDSFNGLLVDYLKDKKINILIKGLRAVSDFEYELQMSLINRKLDRNVETLFLPARLRYIYLSSSVIKDVAQNGGDITGLVPDIIKDDILAGV